MKVHEPFKLNTATRADTEDALATLTLAFSSDPFVRWLYPRPREFLQHFPEVCRGDADAAVDHETFYFLGEFVGAALWLSPDVQPDEAALIEVLENTLSEEKLEQVEVLYEQIEKAIPTDPVWYLSAIGIDPRHQGRGYGAALMKPALTDCDEKKIPAYLESSNPENLSFYHRHGFEILDAIQVGAIPPVYPMLREPQT